MSTKTSNPASQEQPRRRFFKRAVIATLIGGIAAGIGIHAYAHADSFGCSHRAGFMAGPFDPARAEEHLDGMLKHIYVEIDATDEQKQRLAPIIKQAAKDVLPLHQRMLSARKQAFELLAQDSVDRNSIERLRAEHLQIAEQASGRITQALADVAEVLTPAQRKALGSRLQRRHRL
jgi:Spy/CpxP family protein refolding chaperone